MHVDKRNTKRKQAIPKDGCDGCFATKSVPLVNIAHPAKNWVGSFLRCFHPFVFIALPPKALKWVIQQLAQIGENEEIEMSSWKKSDVPEPLVMLYDDLWRDLLSAFNGLTALFEDLLQETKELRCTLTTELAEQMIQKHGVPENTAYTCVARAYDAFFKKNDPKHLTLLVERFGDENLRSKYEELLKVFGSFIALNAIISSLIERIENLFKRHILRQLHSRMREHNLWKKTLTDEKPLNTIEVISPNLLMKCPIEKPPPKSNKVSPRFVAPSILTPSAPPCA
ncbi:MAG: hypothetical protein QXY85_08500 [Candidatus Nitrosocaldus sp.]